MFPILGTAAVAIAASQQGGMATPPRKPDVASAVVDTTATEMKLVPWGPEEKGVQIRALLPCRLVIGDVLKVPLEVTCRADGLPEGKNRIHFEQIVCRAWLELVDRENAEATPVPCRQQRSSVLADCEDRVDEAQPCGVGASTSIHVHSAPGAEALNPGVYTAMVRSRVDDLNNPASGYSPYGRKLPERVRHLWFGELRSAPVQIELVRVPDEKVSCRVPIRLRSEGRRVFYTAADTVSLEFDVPHGYGCSFTYSFDTGCGGGSGLPRDAEVLQDFGPMPKTCEISVTICNEPFGKLQQPRLGSKLGVVWKRTLTVPDGIAPDSK